VQSNDETGALAVISATVVVIGAAAIIASSLHYRRRVEP
jgi:hypothetical protein